MALPSTGVGKASADGTFSLRFDEEESGSPVLEERVSRQCGP